MESNESGSVQDRNKRAYRALIDAVWNRGEIERVQEAMTADYRRHDPALGAPRGPASLVELAARLRAAIEGLRYQVEQLIAEGDQIAARWTITGRHTGALFGVAPTGRPIRITGQSFNRFVDGKVVEGWLHWDAHGLLEQLGAALPLPAP